MLTIVWDVDDVLNPFMRVWFEDFWLPKNPQCSLAFKDITRNPPLEILGLSLEEYRESIDEFRLSDMFLSMEPDAAIYKWFMEHGHLYRHMALTAVPRLGASASANWTLKHFGDWIRTFVFVPSERAGEDIPVYETSKQQYLDWIEKAAVFIEDNPHNISNLENEKIECFLVDRPWNHSSESIESILAKLTDMQS